MVRHECTTEGQWNTYRDLIRQREEGLQIGKQGRGGGILLCIHELVCLCIAGVVLSLLNESRETLFVHITC